MFGAAAPKAPEKAALGSRATACSDICSKLSLTDIEEIELSRLSPSDTRNSSETSLMPTYGDKNCWTARGVTQGRCND